LKAAIHQCIPFTTKREQS